jgi:alkanesulfonate monooxygenase
MSLEFIGMIQPRLQSEIHPADKSIVLDKAYLKDFAQAHEAAGFNRVLIGYYADAPDGFQVAGYVAAHTQRLGLLLAHRPGFVAPTVAARALATLDHVSDGRLAVHIISGGDDADQRRDGDYLNKEERYARTEEYVSVLKAIWTGQGGIDHHGRFYQFENAATAVRCVQTPHIPIYFGGASQAAIDVSARHADVFALWGETYAQVKEITARVQAAAAAQCRKIRFSLSFRPILAATEEAAWARAAKILETTKRVGGQGWLGPNNGAPANEGSRRLLEAAAQGERLDRCLWTGIAAATGARGNTTALVGTPETVAQALLDYWKLGVSTFLIRGFDPLEDATAYGETLLPLTRDLITQHLAAERVAMAINK